MNRLWYNLIPAWSGQKSKCSRLDAVTGSKCNHSISHHVCRQKKVPFKSRFQATESCSLCGVEEQQKHGVELRDLLNLEDSIALRDGVGELGFHFRDQRAAISATLPATCPFTTSGLLPLAGISMAS
eukprot:Gb_12104 [translate_table: standard]